MAYHMAYDDVVRTPPVVGFFNGGGVMLEATVTTVTEAIREAPSRWRLVVAG